MPDNGTGGGMKLSVGIGLNLTGFEALSQIAKELETLQAMALKTEQSFRSMGAALRQTMNLGTAEMSRASERMERAAHSAVPQGAALGEQYASGFSGIGAGLQRQINNDRGLDTQRTREETSQRTSRQAFLSDVMTPLAGVNPVDPELVAKSRLNAGLETQRTRAIAANNRAIQEETEARNRSLNSLKTGIMGGLGVTAAFELANMAHTAIHAIGQMDERVASMRLTGHSDQEIRDTMRGSFENPVHGVNASERMFLGQEMAGILGRAVSDETTKGIAVLARAVTRITGQGDITSNTRNVLRSADAFGNMTDESGELSEKKLLQNAMAVEHGIAVTQGFVSADTFMHNARMAMAPLQALNIANNPHALAQFSVMNEDLGDRAGDTLNNMFRESMAGVSLSSDKGSMLLRHHLFNLNKIEPLMQLPGGKQKLLGFDALSGEGDFLEKLRNAHDVIAADVKRAHPGATPQQIQSLTLAEETKTFGQRAARGMEDIFSETGQAKVAKTEERLRQLGTSIEEIDTQSRNFNDGLNALKTSFEDLSIAMVSTGGLTRMLYGLADVFESIAGFVEKHKAIASVLTEIAGVLGTLLALKGLLGGLKMLGGMFIGGQAAAGLGATAGAEAAAAGVAAAEAGVLARLGGAASTAIMGLSTLNVALLAAAGFIRIAFANKMGQNDVVAYAKSKGFNPETSNKLAKETPLGPNATFGERLDRSFGLGPVGGAFVDDQGRRRTYSDLAREKQFKEEAQAILDQKTYGKGFSGEEYSAPAISTAATPSPARQRPTGPRTMTITHSPNSMLPPTGPVQQTDFDSPLAKANAAQHERQQQRNQEREQRQFLNRFVNPVAPSKVISPTGTDMMHASAMGATEIPSVAGQPKQVEAAPSLKVGTIETNLLIVRGGTQGSGGQPQVGTNATEGAATPSSAGTTSPGLPKSSSETRIAGEPVAPGQPLSPAQMGAISLGTQMGNAYPPEIMAQYRAQKAEAPSASGSAPSGLQSIAPGEPDVGLGPMAGSTPQTGVTPGLGATPPTSEMKGGRSDPATRMAGHRMPTGLHGSTETAPAFTSAQQKDAAAASVKFWMGKGLTKNQAAGMAAQEIQESSGNPRAVGDSGLGIGLYQQHPDRRAAIKAGAGIDLLTADANQQREGAFWEMTHTEKKAWKGIKATSTPEEAGAIASTLFERPRNTAWEEDHRGGIAGRIAMDVPKDIQGPQINPEQADVPASNMTVHINSQHLLDGDMIADHMATHFIGGGATASPSATGYDSKMHPLAPGISVPRW